MPNVVSNDFIRAASSGSSAQQPLRIGIGIGEHDAFTGQIQEVRLYRRALSEAEIQTLGKQRS